MSLDVTLTAVRRTSVYEANITHNLVEMAIEAGIYTHIWRPEEVPISTADQLIEPLRAGIRLLMEDPDRFRKYNPDGWGAYDGFVQFVSEYIQACVANPDAEVRVSR